MRSWLFEGFELQNPKNEVMGHTVIYDLKFVYLAL